MFAAQDWTNVGPDAAYMEIRFTHGGKTLTLKSWHRAAERDPQLVATSQGLERLKGRTRAEILSEDRAYLSKRRAFDAVVDACIQAKRPNP